MLKREAMVSFGVLSSPHLGLAVRVCRLAAGLDVGQLLKALVARGSSPTWQATSEDFMHKIESRERKIPPWVLGDICAVLGRTREEVLEIADSIAENEKRFIEARAAELRVSKGPMSA